ncbi:MAG: ABC transporter permease [Chloroflexia bacterium]|nr:ABC transporter permease [Chloroflexia bacterium]
MEYVLRRLGFYALAAWASITFNFALPRMMPGDPGDALAAQMQGRIEPETLAAMEQAYGLSDDPIWQQYFAYLGNILSGEFGVSTSAFPAPVLQVIQTALWWTLLVGGVAVIISFLIGTTLGMIAAWRRGSWADSVLPPFLQLIGSFPYFWLAMLALFFLGFQWGAFPLRHAYSDELSPAFSWEFVTSVLYHLVLPAGTIVLVSVGGWVLSMRNAMITTLSEDYVTMAEAKGLPQRRVMFSYAARNAMLPNLTQFGMALGFVIGGSLITEIVFAYPGLGYQLITAVQRLDYPLMQGIFLMITLAVLAANLIVDLLYVRLDPRVRRG